MRRLTYFLILLSIAATALADPPCLTSDGVWHKNCNFVDGGVLTALSPNHAMYVNPPRVSYDLRFSSAQGACSVGDASINTPIETVASCTAVGGVLLGAQLLPTDYSGGPLRFEFEAVFSEAVGLGTMSFDISCSCRGEDDVIDNVYGTAEALSLTYASGDLYKLQLGITDETVCDGPCVGGDTAYWRAELMSTTFGGDTEDVRMFRGKIYFPTTGFGDK